MSVSPARRSPKETGDSVDQYVRFLRGEVWLELRQVARLEQAQNRDITSGTRPEIV